MKKPDFDQNNNSADNDQNPVGVGSRKFRHMRKIHAIPPGDKRQWEKDCGYYGENPHGAVLSGVNLRLLHFTNLQGIFPKHLGMIIEPFDPRCIQRKNLTFFCLKKVIGILFQILTEIRQLLIIRMQDQKSFADPRVARESRKHAASRLRMCISCAEESEIVCFMIFSSRSLMCCSNSCKNKASSSVSVPMS